MKIDYLTRNVLIYIKKRFKDVFILTGLQTFLFLFSVSSSSNIVRNAMCSYFFFIIPYTFSAADPLFRTYPPEHIVSIRIIHLCQ